MNTPFSTYMNTKLIIINFYDTYMCIAQASHFKVNSWSATQVSHMINIETPVAEKEIVGGRELLKAWISNTHRCHQVHFCFQ
jgi:peroxiredoxin